MADPTTPRFLGERVSKARHPGSYTFLITQEIQPGQRRLLEGWTLLWMAVGVAMGWVAVNTDVPDERMYLGICLAFWCYFAFRGVQVVLWRRIGREMIRVAPEALSIKRAYGRWGSPRFIPLDQVSRLEVVRPQPKYFFAQWEQAFWIIGGASIWVHTARGVYGLGLQLDERSAQRLAREMDQAIREMRQL